MTTPDRPTTLIAGIGNIFLGDDGFGCAITHALLQTEIPEGAKVVDYGIRGIDLAYALLEPYDKIILVDAISRGEAPGTVYVLRPAEGTSSDASLDPHSMDPVHLMAMARLLGEIAAAIYIVGCEPLDFGDELEGRMGLSDRVRNSIPEAVRAVLDVVHLPLSNIHRQGEGACAHTAQPQGEYL